VALPEAIRQRSSCFQRNLKEFVMNEAPELEVVDLGEAKELTKGVLIPPHLEDNPARPYRPA
jgi:hypothetical protein